MLRHSGLYDPIVKTRAMQKEEFTKYVDMCEPTPSPDADQVISEEAMSYADEIKTKFYDAHKNVKTERLDQIWNVIEPQLLKNSGLGSFTLDYDGANSDYFFPWLINIAKSPSLALEMAYGAGENLEGKWVYPIPKDDPIDFFVRNDPTFVYNRERQLFVADLAYSVHDNSYEDVTIGKVVDFGAGRLAWARWHGFFDKIKHVKIYAFDKDPSIEPKELFDKKTYERYITYKTGDLTTELTNPDCAGASLVILGGVASYIPDDVFVGKIVPAIYQLLAPGGYFFFDRQVDCPYLRRSMKVFSWPKMYLPDNATKAIDIIEGARKALWQKDIKFLSEYALDGYNEYPTAVMTTFQKL